MLYGAMLPPSESLHRIYAPALYSVPTIEILSETAEIELSSLDNGIRAVTGKPDRSVWESSVAARSDGSTFALVSALYSISNLEADACSLGTTFQWSLISFCSTNLLPSLGMESSVGWYKQFRCRKMQHQYELSFKASHLLAYRPLHAASSTDFLRCRVNGTRVETEKCLYWTAILNLHPSHYVAQWQS
jgi:hypothetical protein